MKKLESFYPLGRIVRWYNHYREQCGTSPRKLNLELPCDPGSPVVGVWLQALIAGTGAGVCTVVFRAALRMTARARGSPRVHWQMKARQNVVYLCDGVSVSLRKGGDSDPHDNLGAPWGHYSKWNVPDTEGRTVIPLLRATQTSQTRTESTGWLQGLVGGQDGESCLMDSRVSVSEDENGPETGVGDSHRTGGIRVMPQNYTLWSGLNGNFHLKYILPQFF